MSNGRQIGTIVGSLVAAYFTAGTSYAAFAVAAGGAVGGAVGGAIDGPTKIQGPRLDDLKVQVSSYGVGIPWFKGTERFGGNVIWSTDKIERPFVEEQGGKGGAETETTSYRYFVHMRQLLCETPRDGSTVSIVKIFQDGKLIWDASSGIPVGSALASAENPAASFILYQGHQDQLPNPEEESFEGGPGSVSAYRGVVSIFMRDIECPGGRVPQFSLVLSANATSTTERLFYGKAAGNTDSRVSIVNGEITQIQNYPATESQTIRVTPILRQGAVSPPNAWTALEAGAVHWRIVAVSQAASVRGIHPVASAPGIGVDFAYTLVDFDARSETLIAGGIISDPWVELNPQYAVEDPISATWMLKGASNRVILLPSKTIVPLPVSESGAGYYNELIYTVTYTSSKLQFVTLDATGAVVASVENPAITGSAPKVRITVAQDGVSFYVVATTPNGAGARPIWKVSASGWVLLCADTGVVQTSVSYAEAYCTDTYAVIGPSNNDVTTGEVSYQMVRFDALTTSEVKAKDIIAEQCERAGEARYDVSALPDSDTVYGYKIAGPATSRANIEPILTAFGYFIVDEDGLIKVKRYADITSVTTVSFDELGQSEGDTPADAMPMNRTQEIDLPRSVTASYIEPTNDFNTASETEVRQVTEGTEDMQVQLPVCVTSDRAKKVAQMALYDQYRRQNQRSLTVSRKFSFVSPGDGVTVEYPRGTFKLWLVLSTNDTGALCEWGVVPGDAAIFTQTAVGATGYAGQEVSPLAAATRAQILDMPIVRDADNNAGPYVALDSYAAEPANAELLVGDDDLTLQSRGTVSASAPIGFAETALAGWSRVAVDETNLFTVSLGDDVFGSVTRDVLLAGGAEYWAYGVPGRWEIGASAQGDSLGGGRYVLSRHLRGLLGTERNTGNHAVGDVFVLLRIAGMLRPDSGVGGIGQDKSYRAVTKGRSTNSTNSQIYANTGEGLMPLSPVNLRRITANGGFTVDRRSRLAMNNSTGSLPLGETTEHFTWEFYSSGTFTTLLGTVVTNTATVTAAQITAIGVTPSATAFLKVRQVSDSIGPGHELQASV